MIIENIIRQSDITESSDNVRKDIVFLEWYELNKKIMRKRTQDGVEIGFRLDQKCDSLKDQDIVFAEEGKIITIVVKPCLSIEISWHNQEELARICYEIGNRHAPLFFHESGFDKLLIPYDAPMTELLKKMNIHFNIRDARLVHPINSNTAQHAH